MTYYLAIALILLQVADAGTTYYVIKRGGYEANPILNRLNNWLRGYTNAKWAWLFLSKVFVAVAAWYLASTGQTLQLAAVTLVYGYIIFNNIKVIRRIK